LLTILCLLAAMISLPSAVFAQPENFARTGERACLTCHNRAPANALFKMAHASRADDRSPYNDHDCETCHGASPEHRRTVSLPTTVVFSGSSNNAFPASSVETQNSVCLGCHENGQRTHWQNSEHQFAELACTSCHDIHKVRDPVLDKTNQPAVCTGCHLEKQAQLKQRSHHPVLEGLMACSDCHNPHGSAAEHLLAGATTNETCTNCHAEKRGPFLWEHEPVTDNCTNCHNPHGSVVDRLLQTRTPFLCQDCHQDAFHPSTLYNGEDIPPFGAAQQLLGQACLNCHSQIHGSNHPSGSRFTR
jgi:DmsE family decaheme c-type cytochrome